MGVCACIYIYIYMCVCVCVCVCDCLYISIYTQIHIYVDREHRVGKWLSSRASRPLQASSILNLRAWVTDRIAKN